MTSVRSLRCWIILFASIVATAADSGANAQEPVKKAERPRTTKSALKAVHRVAIKVYQNDKAVMDLR